MKTILGSLLGRRSCQRLNVNRQYIVFLEPFFDGTYRPVDLEEIPYTKEVDIILEKTCGLSSTYPFTETNDTEARLTSKCPSAVSVNCPLGIFNYRYLHMIDFLFTETSKMSIAPSTTTPSPPTLTTTTTKSVSKPTISSSLFGKDPIDYAALSLLLAEQQNLSLALLQDPNHKSLFSDDDARKNHANQCSFILSIHCIIFSIFYIIF